MPTENVTTPTPAPTPFNSVEFKELVRTYHQCPEKEQGQYFASNPELKAGLLKARELEARALPMYAAALHLAEVSPTLDKVRLARDTVLTGVALWAVGKGATKAWGWYRAWSAARKAAVVAADVVTPVI